MNVILVIFASLRKDCVNVYGPPPWGKVRTPHFQAFARESLVMERVYPESLPTLPARRAIYTGRRTYPFENGDFRLKGDFVPAPAPGWGPIPEEQPTLAEVMHDAGFRTALVADVYHMFKPSKNFWRGFDQWTFLRGQEIDPYRSGPRPTQEQLDCWLPRERQAGLVVGFMQQIIMNYHDRVKEEDYFAPRVLKEAALWLEQNRDASKFFLTVESFDPHEPWYAPEHYRKSYVRKPGPEQVISWYREMKPSESDFLERTQMNYYAEVDMCDRWFGYLMERLDALNLLDDTMVILTSDHGHSIGDRDYLGKRGYPSSPEVYDIPLMVRFPGGEHGGKRSGNLIQHHDIFAAILEMAEIDLPREVEGIPFLKNAAAGRAGGREHATVGWGTTPTVVTDRWWFNCKMDGTGVLLYDLTASEPFARNVAADNTDTVNSLFALAKKDAGGSFPEWLLEMARTESDAPGCSPIAARV